MRVKEFKNFCAGISFQHILGLELTKKKLLRRRYVAEVEMQLFSMTNQQF